MAKKMKSKASKVTPNKAAYRSELKKLARQVRYYAKTYGGTIPDEVKALYSEPKIVTKKSLERIRDFRKNISEFVVVQRPSGELSVLGEFNKYERSYIKRERAHEIDSGVDLGAREWANQIIENFKDQNSFWGSSPKSNDPVGRDMIFDWLDKLITQQGEYKVAVMLVSGAAEGLIIQNAEAYEGDSAKRYIARMLNYLDTSDDVREAWINQLEESEDPDEPKYADEGRIY